MNQEKEQADLNVLYACIALAHSIIEDLMCYIKTSTWVQMLTKLEKNSVKIIQFQSKFVEPCVEGTKCVVKWDLKWEI